jgi:ribosomal protein S18 acetylase RimI-like enzyme
MISPATLADVPALNVLINSAYRGDSSRRGWTTEADLLGGIRTSEETLRDTLSKPNSTMLLYTADEQVVGCVYLEKKDVKLYLGMLTVAPDAQAGGIGRQLLTHAEGYARTHGCQAIMMTVISQRHELIAWYERRGYQRTGETQPFPMNDPRFGEPKTHLEFIVMEKPL